MHNHSRTLALVTALLCGVPLSGQAQTPAPRPTAGKVTLRYKFISGQTVRYKMTLDLDGSFTSANGTYVPVKQHLDVTLHQTVKAVRDSDGAATLATQIDTLTMTLNGRAFPIPQHLQQQFKQPYTLVMTPSGKALSFKMLNMATLPGTGIVLQRLPDPRALPNQAVGVSDTWHSTHVSAKFGLTENFNHTLTRISESGDTATIGHKIYAMLKPPMAVSQSDTMTQTYKLNQLLTGTGTETFDIAAGQVADQTNDIMMKEVKIFQKTGHITKREYHITTDMERVPDTGAGAGAATARPAPTDEPPTGQLQ